MITDRPEALSILRKWLEESTLLYCQANLSVLAAGLEVRIVSVSNEEVCARSEDGNAEIAVVLGRAVAFGFGDMRSSDEGKDFDFGLVVFFDEPTEVDTPEYVTFAERRLPS